MFIDGDTSSINRNRIRTSVGISNWRYRIHVSVRGCDCIHTNSIVCDKVDIKKIKLRAYEKS